METVLQNNTIEIPCDTQIIIFTDLDGTFLNDQYSFAEAGEAFSLTKEREIPVVIVTSKTKLEVEKIQKDMGVWQKEPFIIENGGAVYIPLNYFHFDIRQEVPGAKISTDGKFIIVELGKPYSEVRRVMKEAALEVGLDVEGIGDISPEQFSLDTGLTMEDAVRAQQRQYQEGFKIINPNPLTIKEDEKRLKEAIEKRGFCLSIGGRYYQIMGSPAKVRAVEILINLYKKEYGNIFSVGLGDAPSDLDFMNECDQGFLLNNPRKKVEEGLSENITRIDTSGPDGWNEAIISVIKFHR
ncbi:MAG: Mannosyl-3-phosphoglycerate phosphatase [Candidatus Collierbacteria bacterium GW2011_GWB1_44_6]|uniref:Mannosyl-3-phosphoglycerate phosphatase n=2 Tax=Candidatus Collieribacteriota TaxID=1752725 RepID=A0A0G1JQ59_9BACT|nr:MAG: Mannosyl-3-phosphoglycerate phosphatase [Candidatus Collierbacteria bacterium GW2011_GWC2_43_12]KKT73656.1 MAG: Mannosyl-3-phosphoglycerate phosphatase [Candidatus Collierbacteria bacterium GW2011_GWB1_44_6]KKT83566.1 MAG: Mannosyl-3-phosphoglycerate phosphatase [Microgenomates group bacterium GW2011_GWC1_44_9]